MVLSPRYSVPSEGLIPAKVGVVQVSLFELVPVHQSVPDLLVGLIVVPDADQRRLAG